MDAARQGVFKNFYFSVGTLDGMSNNKLASFSCKNEGQRFFDLSSITKAIVAAPLVFRYLNQNKYSLETMLKDAFPKASAHLCLIDRLRQMKVIDVLNHEAGFLPWKNFSVDSAFKTNPKDTFLQTQESLLKKDSTNQYSDIGHILLTLLLESEVSLSVRHMFSDFLKTEFGLLEKQIELGPGDVFPRCDVASTGFCQIRGRVLRGEVHDENCFAFGGFTLHSGLFGSGEGLKQFLMQLNTSKFGKNFLHHLNDQYKAKKTGDSYLGWRTGRDPITREFYGGECLGHYGFTGCAFWINLELKTFVILLTDRVSMSRTDNITQIKKIRQFCFSKATLLSQNFLNG